MIKIYDKIDFYWTFDGDLLVAPEGDLQDTEIDPLLSLLQEIKTRIRGEQQEWELYPDVGASLSSLIGEPNNKITAETGKTKIIASLTKDGFIAHSDISIKYMPVGIYNLLYRVTVKVTPTPKNTYSESVQIQILYSYVDNNFHLI